jgi:uncharacterized membrane protein
MYISICNQLPSRSGHQMQHSSSLCTHYSQDVSQLLLVKALYKFDYQSVKIWMYPPSVNTCSSCYDGIANSVIEDTRYLHLEKRSMNRG